MRPEKAILVEGALNSFKEMGRNAPKIVIPEAIESAKKPGDNGTRIPTGGRERRREAVFNGNLADRGDKELPARFPPFQGNPGGPEHGREIHGNNGASR